MRLRRMYIRVGLSGLVCLILMTAVLWFPVGEAAAAFFYLTFYWIALCLIVGLILVAVSGVRRFARFVRHSY
jgi:hypothetical protein